MNALPPMPHTPQRVLLIKPSALGDVITALPVLHGLRRSVPDAHIAWLLSSRCGDILSGMGGLDEVVPFERSRLGRAWRSVGALSALRGFRRTLRAGRYDMVIDLQGLLRSALFARWTHAAVRAGFADAREGATHFYTHRIGVDSPHTVDRNIELARQLGLDARPEDLRLELSDATHHAAAALLAGHGLENQQFCAVVPPTRWKTKQYPPRLWRRVVASLAGEIPVVLLGSPSPRERDLCAAVAEDIHGVVDLAGQTSPAEMAAVLAGSRGVVCCDSAAKFIAPAVGVNALVLMGPTRMEHTGPYKQGKAMVAEVPCQGCLKKRCGHITCMQSIEPEKVITAARAMLSMGGKACRS